VLPKYKQVSLLRWLEPLNAGPTLCTPPTRAQTFQAGGQVPKSQGQRQQSRSKKVQPHRAWRRRFAKHSNLVETGSVHLVSSSLNHHFACHWSFCPCTKKPYRTKRLITPAMLARNDVCSACSLGAVTSSLFCLKPDSSKFKLKRSIGKIRILPIERMEKILDITTISSKGQVVIPKALRQSSKWPAGTRLEVLQTSEGLLLKPLKSGVKGNLNAGLKAIREKIGYSGKPLSTDQLEAVIAREAKRTAKV
jgi:AbrB family looped-hinge helix DNA binding protein